MGSLSILRSESRAGHDQMLLMPDGAMHQAAPHTSAVDLVVSHVVGPLIKPAGFDMPMPSKGWFGHDEHYVEQDLVAFWDEPSSEWCLLFVFVVSLVFLDAFVVQKLVNSNVSSYRAHVGMVLFWIFFGLSYNLCWGYRHGWVNGVQWFNGYLLEWMLSLDNLFAFQVVMRTYAAPHAIQHKALFLGVIGSMLSRLVLFLSIGKVLTSINYIQFLFGLMLIYAGVQTLHDDDDDGPEDSFIVRLLKKCLGSRLHDSYDMENHNIFIRHPVDGRWCATLLLPLIICIEITDVIFAVDSVSAKVAQIPNQYAAYSSSVFALLGLRAMYFVMNDLTRFHEPLKYGVCFILVFIGSELMISWKFQLPDWIVCMVICTVFNICIVYSLLQKAISPSDASADAATEAASSSSAKKGDDQEELLRRGLQKLAGEGLGLGSAERAGSARRSSARANSDADSARTNSKEAAQGKAALGEAAEGQPSSSHDPADAAHQQETLTMPPHQSAGDAAGG